MLDDDNEETAQLRGRDGKRIIMGSMPLLTCMSFLSLTETSHLVVKAANLKVINDIKQVCIIIETIFLHKMFGFNITYEATEGPIILEAVRHNVRHIELYMFFFSQTVTHGVRHIEP